MNYEFTDLNNKKKASFDLKSTPLFQKLKIQQFTNNFTVK